MPRLTIVSVMLLQQSRPQRSGRQRIVQRKSTQPHAPTITHFCNKIGTSRHFAATQQFGRFRGKNGHSASCTCDIGLKMPRSIWNGAVVRRHPCGSQGIGRLARPRARPRTPRRYPWDRFAPKPVDPKERRFNEATICRPLSGRAAIVLQLEEGQLAFLGGLSLQMSLHR
jgi:hypothetical protein